jgi:hypothetical protein
LEGKKRINHFFRQQRTQRIVSLSTFHTVKTLHIHQSNMALKLFRRKSKTPVVAEVEKEVSAIVEKKIAEVRFTCLFV